MEFPSSGWGSVIFRAHLYDHTHPKPPPFLKVSCAQCISQPEQWFSHHICTFHPHSREGDFIRHGYQWGNIPGTHFRIQFAIFYCLVPNKSHPPQMGNALAPPKDPKVLHHYSLCLSWIFRLRLVKVQVLITFLSNYRTQRCESRGNSLKWPERDDWNVGIHSSKIDKIWPVYISLDETN